MTIHLIQWIEGVTHKTRDQGWFVKALQKAILRDKVTKSKDNTVQMNEEN